MFSKISILITAAVAASALAMPTRRDGGSQCNVGELQCCEDVKDAHDSSLAGLLGLLGVAVQSITAQVGLTCSPIDVIGIAGNSCSAQPVCCTGNNFNGLVALGCTPVNLNL